MRHLIRSRFLDVPWDASDLDSLAELWMQFYERAAVKNQFRALPYHELEVRLRGFPRHRAEELQAELRTRLSSWVPQPQVSLSEPDTLTVSSGFARFNKPPADGLGLPWLEGELFDGLLAEVRFTVAGFRDRPRGNARVQATLVLVGELRGGRLLVKAIWRAGPTGWEDPLHWAAPWEDQTALLGALSIFRATGAVHAELVDKFMVTRAADRVGRLGVNLIHVPLDRPRLGGLLGRLLIFGVAFIAGTLAAVAAVLTRTWLVLLVPLFVGLVLGGLFWAFVKHELRMFFVGHASYRRGYARTYRQFNRIVPLLPEEAASCLDNPWARKYIAELLALGCTHAGDFRLDPEVSGRASTSLFLAPDGVTHVLLMVMVSTSEHDPVVFHMWPGVVSLLADTLFPDGARFTSVTGVGGFRKKRSGPESQVRRFNDVSDPAELLQRHTEAMRTFDGEMHRAPLAHLSGEDYLRRHEEFQEAERQRYLRAPYSWADHLHCYLGIVRREYRERA
jgi:hypothetical protein